MFKKLAVIGAASMITFSAYAMIERDVSETVQLKDGATLYIFTDGKMGLENRYGRAVPVPGDHAVETRDGRSIVLEGNEIARVSVLRATRFGQ